LLICVFGSLICLLTGLTISFLTAFGLLSRSHRFAYLTVGALLGFFGMMLLGAHCMDRCTEEEKARRREEFQTRVLTDKEFSR
jgi:hypothetical protein